MQCAEQTLREEWHRLGNLSFAHIRQSYPDWMPHLTPDSETWSGWLNAQWQTYWSAVAIALENMWEAEDEAKEHEYSSSTGKKHTKDAVQVRVIYGNGNVLKATCKFDTFHQWQRLLKIPDLEPALFEQAAQLWEQHPVPVYEAIACWCVAFCDRREKLHDDNRDTFREALSQFIQALWITTSKDELDKVIKNWLKLTAFILRKRKITINI